MAGRVASSRSQGSGAGGAVLKQLVQTLRGDLNLLSNEARKRYPAVREVGVGVVWRVGGPQDLKCCCLLILVPYKL